MSKFPRPVFRARSSLCPCISRLKCSRHGLPQLLRLKTWEELISLMTRIDTREAGHLAMEMGCSVALVALFSAAYPDRFRTRLWENGGVEGWNSNPNHRIYFYANHREPPEIPLIWAQRLTDSNLAIAVLSLVVSLVRAITRRYDYLPRLAGILYDVILLLLWTYSIVAQVSGDLSDPEHPSPRPWYMTRGCQAGWETNRGICRATQASFAFSVMAVAVYCSRLVIQAAELIQERVGRRHYRGWQSLESGDGGGYNDDDHEIYKEKEDTAQRAIEDALSPVLAFFPER